MTDPRLPPERERRTSRARFRCTVCERFVRATEYGVCPSCGLGPPQVLHVEAPRRSPGAGYWIGAALFALAIGLGGALLAVC